MSARSAEELRGLVLAGRLPWSRARATRNWIRAFASIAGIRLLVLLSLPFVAGVALGELVHKLVAAAVFPGLFLFIVAYSQRHYLRRPPKALLAAQLACFSAGATLQLLAILGDPAIEVLAKIAFWANLLLIGCWFVGVLLAPEE